jgi:uncharacterized membrane protein YdjX (TVP38/TMEM64 family)
VRARNSWAIGGLVAAVVIGYCGWRVLTDACAYPVFARVCLDQGALEHALRQAGSLAPLIFIAIQAVAPVPGEVSSLLAGYLFGQWPGFLYSAVGGTLGSVVVFGAGRWLGVRYARSLVSPELWQKLGFIVDAEGAILCFVLFLIPGLPKDVVCCLFGLSPMRLWVFVVASALGRLPSIWVLSAQGAHAAAGNYAQVVLLAAVAAAAALPLVYYRNQIVGWFTGGSVSPTDRRG